MSDDKSGRELTPREPGEVEATDSSLAPVEGESRDVERFSAGRRAHSVGLTEERSAQIVRQSANSRNVVFLAILLVALFIPVYWFYENGVPALGTEGRMAAEAEAQYVTDVARGYELYIANCAECHGEAGQGGIGPRLNDQGKLYNVLTPGGAPGTGHLNPNYLENVLVVGGRYICGDPDSLMAAWQEPNGPLNYRQVEELIVWLTASQDIVFERHLESHGEGGEDHGDEPEFVSGWRDPNFVPAPDDTPVPACWKAPDGLTAAPPAATGTTDAGTTDSGTTDSGTTTPPAIVGTPDEPRQIELQANAALQFTDTSGAQVTQIEVVPGETVEFVIDNTAGFDHNFYLGTADVLQSPFAETEAGIPTWQSGVQTFTWTVPEEGLEGLQFACTVPGHYQPMHGDIVVTAPAPEGASGEVSSGEAPAQEPPAEAAPADGGETAVGGTPDAPRQIELQANAALQFTDTSGAQVTQIEVIPGETVEFVIDNTAGFDHNFWIGEEDVLMIPSAETDVGIPTWQSGVQTFTWTVPEEGADGLQFACTVPGHYQPMHGNFVISSGAPAAGGDAGAEPPAGDGGSETVTEEAPAEEPAAGEAAAAGGTADAPRVINIDANAALQFTGEDGNILTNIAVTPGETVEFVIDNTAGFDHNFWIGTAEELQGSFAETEVGIPTWQSGEQTITWTVPEEGAEVLQFACTVPGHYTPMHGNFVIQG